MRAVVVLLIRPGFLLLPPLLLHFLLRLWPPLPTNSGNASSVSPERLPPLALPLATASLSSHPVRTAEVLGNSEPPRRIPGAMVLGCNRHHVLFFQWNVWPPLVVGGGRGLPGRLQCQMMSSFREHYRIVVEAF